MSSHHVLAAVSRRYDLSSGKESEVQDAADLVLLARKIPIMAANEHITLNGPGFEENLRAILEDPPVQDQVLLWHVLRKPMRLAAFYQFTAVRIGPALNSKASD